MNARVTELAAHAAATAAVGEEPVALAALRMMLRWPGQVLDVLDGHVQAPPPEAPIDAAAAVPVYTPEAYLALQPGLAHHHDADGFAAFTLRGGTALVVGGPQAPEACRQQVLRGVVAATRQLGVRRQVLFPVRPAALDDVRQVGFAATQVGVEAWVDLHDFTLAGKRWAHLRQMRNRAEKRGVEVEEPRPGPWDEAMERVWDAWVAAKHPRWSLRWLTGTPSLEQPLDRRYFVAQAAGRLQAFCTVLPGPDGTWAVDVLCRAPDAIPGSMERLLVQAFEILREEGARSVNLGPCPLAGRGDDGVEDGPSGLMGAAFRWAWRSSLAERLFGFRGLHAFKAKFRPRWEPVYLAAAPRLGWVEMYAAARLWALG